MLCIMLSYITATLLHSDKQYNTLPHMCDVCMCSRALALSLDDLYMAIFVLMSNVAAVTYVFPLKTSVFSP
jgi:16S rRNA A1518/A1519 N6-dimethyltransferase RsmA/KsgA/DIM1 with predicted DNA glycosylase/AP lyase activity